MPTIRLRLGACVPPFTLVLQNLLLFPHVGRKQKAEGVRKFVTRKYAYLIYYTVDEAAEEIVILNVKHPARRREHEDA